MIPSIQKSLKRNLSIGDISSINTHFSRSIFSRGERIRSESTSHRSDIPSSVTRSTEERVRTLMPRKNMSSLVNGSMPGDSSSIFLVKTTLSSDHSRMISCRFLELLRKYRDFFWNTESFLYTQLMNLRQKRLADVIRTYASQSIMNYEQMRPHAF